MLLPHASVLSGVSAINRHICTVPTDVLVQWVPLFHDMGLVALLCSLLTPCDAHLFGTSTFIRSPERVLAYIADTNGSIVTGPNFSYDRFIAAAAKSGLTGPALSSWRLALPATLEQIVDADGVKRIVHEMTEAGRARSR